MMTLLWPWLLMLLLIIPLLVAVYVWVLRRRRRYAVRYSTLSIIREARPMVVELQLPVMGAYAGSWPYDCAKSRKILDGAAAFVAAWQHPNGYCGWQWNPLIFLAHPDLKYRDSARRAAYYMTDDLVEFDTTKGHPYDRGLTSWRYGYKALYLSEYYLVTGDRTVLPALSKIVDWIAWSLAALLGLLLWLQLRRADHQAEKVQASRELVERALDALRDGDQEIGRSLLEDARQVLRED